MAFVFVFVFFNGIQQMFSLRLVYLSPENKRVQVYSILGLC